MLDVNAVILTEEGHKKAEGFPADIPLVPSALEGPLPVWRGREGSPDTAETAVIFSTSGTSGLPKAVACLHSNMLGNLAPIEAHVPGLLDDDAVFLNVLPNFHTFGYNLAGMMPVSYTHLDVYKRQSIARCCYLSTSCLWRWSRRSARR